MKSQAAFAQHLLYIGEHSLADAGNGQHFFFVRHQLRDLLRKGFDSFGGIAIGANAERICGVDFKQVGSFVENSGDGLIVHARRLKQGLRIDKAG